ncbi:hypothetical protein B9Z55_008018 [Caenorhabditis nigoni]|uniref:Uncharacterized protein n=1 Tax=Caenorhabditis nigoni TaxID=1611254 RepID=A0A2G5VC96_9PELO|nr:hypothetical protein B9Z55_008018 [Caenorhabditis nigoni]
MSVTLAYPAMGPILEFMEANKRIHLTSRCPALHTIDKSTQLRLDSLEFRTNCIEINKMSYELCHCDQQYVENQNQIDDKSSREALAPGDIQMDGDAFPKFRNFVAFRIRTGLGRESVRRLPAHLEIHVALKKLSSYLLGGRTTPIKVADEKAAIGYALILPINETSELMVVEAKMPKNQQSVLQLVVQPKVDRSAFTHKIIDHIYTYWLLYSFLTNLVWMGGSIVFCVMMGTNAIPWVVGLIVISFSFLWFIVPAKE